ncbi:MAG: cache domain-containing protein [Cycloclasticus sp.]|jgi:methyl-accepting chemotaxis protein
MNISQKIHTPMVVALVLGLGVLVVTSLMAISDIETDVYQAEEDKLLDYYAEKYQTKLDLAISNVIDLSQNEAIISSLIENDRRATINRLSAVIQSYKVHTKFQNIKIHVHDRDIRSFVRIWNLDKYGDDLKAFRHTIVSVKQTKKPVVAVEIGRVGLVLRGIPPTLIKANTLAVLNSCKT